ELVPARAVVVRGRDRDREHQAHARHGDPDALDQAILASRNEQHGQPADERQQRRDRDRGVLPGHTVPSLIVHGLVTKKVSRITPTNSPTAYHCTLPVWTVRTPRPNNAAIVPAPFTTPSITVRSNQAARAENAY